MRLLVLTGCRRSEVTGLKWREVDLEVRQLRRAYRGLPKAWGWIVKGVKLSVGTPLGAWLRGLLARAHVNTVVVALAAKLARIAWAVIRRGEKFNMKAATAS